uniref:Uncharacterized protein n=1 Tax=Oryza nivara TaxID=4536 RepID=A0A0E0FKK5_ORYNI
MRMFDVNETLLSNLPYYADHRYRRGADSLHPLCPMLRPPHSAEKGTGDDGMLCAECSGERARATTACSAQSAQGRTSHRIGNGAEPNKTIDLELCP